MFLCPSVRHSWEEWICLSTDTFLLVPLSSSPPWEWKTTLPTTCDGHLLVHLASSPPRGWETHLPKSQDLLPGSLVLQSSTSVRESTSAYDSRGPASCTCPPVSRKIESNTFAYDFYQLPRPPVRHECEKEIKLPKTWPVFTCSLVLQSATIGSESYLPRIALFIFLSDPLTWGVPT